MGPAQAQGTDPAVDPCASLLVRYPGGGGGGAQAWRLMVEGEGGALQFYGAEHSRDPGHPQFDGIEEAFAQFRPTLVFYEGPERPLETTREATITGYGESGFVRFLAARDGVPVARLEPDPRAEFRAVMAEFEPEQVALFYVLREAARLRDREGLSQDALRAAVAQLLERAAAVGAMPFATLDELEAAYARYWNEPARWWEAPQRWFDPNLSSEATGGLFTNDVNRASSEFRNEHMYRVLSEAVRQGERVFAVVGRNHVPMQAPALRCALGQ